MIRKNQSQKCLSSFAFFISQSLLILTVLTTAATNDMTSSVNPLIAIAEFDWDVAVSLGTSINLLEIQTGDSRELKLPFPTLEKTGNRSQILKNASLDLLVADLLPNRTSPTEQLTYEMLKTQWPHFEIKYLVSDASKHLLYLSLSSRPRHGNHKLLCTYNFTSCETKLLLQTFSGSIDYLLLHEGDIIFSDSGSQAILKLKTSEANFFQRSTSLLPIVLKQVPDNVVISGLAVDPMTRKLFWSSEKPSTILYEDGGEEKVFISTDLKKAHDIVIFDSQLYFVNTPQGGSGSNRIERASLFNSSNREIVINFKERNQFPVTITSVCGTLYWTDSLSASLWKLPLFHKSKPEASNLPVAVFKSSRRNRYFKTLVPYAVTSRRNLNKKACILKKLIVEDIAPTVTMINQTVLSSNQSETQTASFLVTENVIKSTMASNPNGNIGGTVPGISEQDVGDDFGLKLTSESLTPELVETTTSSNPNVKFCGEDDGKTLCLNGATCLSFQKTTLCLCPLGYTGPKCELDWDQITVSKSIDEECSSTNLSLLILTAVLLGVVAGLAAVIIILSVKVCRLTRVPRIHRRFVVPRSAAQRRRFPSANGCELIDIENCCNMTICDTPCYDTVSGEVSLVKESRKHEDKERLLPH